MSNTKSHDVFSMFTVSNICLNRCFKKHVGVVAFKSKVRAKILVFYRFLMYSVLQRYYRWELLKLPRILLVNTTMECTVVLNSNTLSSSDKEAIFKRNDKLWHCYSSAVVFGPFILLICTNRVRFVYHITLI